MRFCTAFKEPAQFHPDPFPSSYNLAFQYANDLKRYGIETNDFPTGFSPLVNKLFAMVLPITHTLLYLSHRNQ